MGTGMIRPAAFFLAFLVQPCLAQRPVLQQLDPPGGQLGKALVLRLVGRNLPADLKMITPLPATFTPMTSGESGSSMQGPGRQVLPYLVELDRDVPVGLYPIRVSSPQGLSNILLFSVGVFPEVREEESLLTAHQALNDSPAASQELERVPVTVTGTLNGPERDVYRFEGRAGDELVLEVEARRVGSALDPLIRLLDAGEREIASNDDAPGLDVDCRLDVVLPEDGPYYVVIHDSRFSEQTDNFYRLKVGSFSYAEALFPLGGRTGSKVDIELLGGNLRRPTRLILDLDGIEAGSFVRVPVPGLPGALPLLFAVSDLPEVLVPDLNLSTELQPGMVVNGRISRAGEIDRFSLAVVPGESWGIELVAARLGMSRLSGLIMILDEEGERIASGGDDSPSGGDFSVVPRGLTSSDPYVNFKVPDGVNRVLISVADLIGRGGSSFGYRLEARREPADFTLVLRDAFVNLPAGGTARVSVLANRRGYKGAIRLSVSGDMDGLLVQGGDIPPDIRTTSDFVDVGVLTLSARPDAKARITDLVVWGESVSEEGQVIRRKALGPGLITNVLVGTGRSAPPTVRDVQKPFTAPWLGLDLPVMVTSKLGVRVVLEPPAGIQLVQGAERTLKWRLESDGSDGPLPELVFLEAPGITEVRVEFLDEQGKPKANLVNPTLQGGDVRLRTTVGTPLGRFNVLVNVDIKVGGETQRLSSPAIAVEVVQGYEIEVLSESVSLDPGGRAELVGKLSRSEGFAERVDIRVENLPPGLTCAPVHVDSGEDQFGIPCEALDSSQPGEYTVELISSSVLPGYEKENVPYTVPAVRARLIVKAHREAASGKPGS